MIPSTSAYHSPWRASGEVNHRNSLSNKQEEWTSPTPEKTKEPTAATERLHHSTVDTAEVE
ncbi:hypothetical protein DY000_02046125 [Brassica cretica]|uniref:Peroxin-14 n=1 Tax=Brassica cretica TaxID=69181 RepID=A0ABQ7EUW2_BRACR|nr:hypothetical protein DY000_02046125 [Brassica cretica]